jgi:hypothetical protein
MQESNRQLMQLNVSFERDTDKIRVQTTAGPPMTSPASVQSYHQQRASQLSKTIETANRDPRSHLGRAAEDAGKHVVALDRALEEEPTRSIESVGRQLTASLQCLFPA